MPPKGGNAKKEAGRAKKEANEIEKKGKASAAAEAAEAAEWSKGAKSNKKNEDAAAKLAEKERAKAEKARLLAEEEASLPSKPKVAGGAKKAGEKKKKVEPRPAGPGAIAAGGGIAAADVASTETSSAGPEAYSATGIDQMLDALELVNQKTDKASMGAKAGQIEKHPERRFKAAFEAYVDREMPKLKEDHPGLRKQQMHDILFKQFQKSPENPFNQVTVAHNATKDEKLAALEAVNKEKEARVRV